MSRENRIESFNRVDKIAKEKGLSFYVICNDLGLARSLFSDWKIGKSMPKTDKLIKIADYLGTTVEYIIGQSKE